MGFKKWRVARRTIPTDLLCVICNEVLKHPVSCSACKSYLCSDCVALSDRLPQKCPHLEDNIVPVHRLLEQKISSIPLYCSFKAKGCRAVLALDKVDKHEKTCKFADGDIGELIGSPSKTAPKELGSSVCHRGCGRQVSAKELSTHDCVKHLKAIADRRNAEIVEISAELNAKLAKLQEVEKQRVLFINTTNTEIETLKAQLAFVQDERDSLALIKRQTRSQQTRTEIQYKIFKETSATYLEQYIQASGKEFEGYFKEIVKEVRDYTRRDRKNYYNFQGKTSKSTHKFATSMTPVKVRSKEASRTTVSTLSRSISPMKNRSFYSVPTSPSAVLR